MEERAKCCGDRAGAGKEEPAFTQFVLGDYSVPFGEQSCNVNAP
jgi:hypothetical protein